MTSVVTAIATVLFVSADTLDPTAGTVTVSVALPRALWLIAAAIIVALTLAPAALTRSLARTGGTTALASAGGALTRLLVVPIMVVGLLGAAGVYTVTVAAVHGSVAHPGTRPQPLDVVPWGAPTLGCWDFTTSTTPRFVPAVSPGATAPCIPHDRQGMAWLLALAALLAGPIGGSAATPRRWALVGASMGLLALVAGVVVGAHALVAGARILRAGCLVAGTASIGAGAAWWVGHQD